MRVACRVCWRLCDFGVQLLNERWTLLDEGRKTFGIDVMIVGGIVFVTMSNVSA